MFALAAARRAPKVSITLLKTLTSNAGVFGGRNLARATIPRPTPRTLNSLDLQSRSYASSVAGDNQRPSNPRGAGDSEKEKERDSAGQDRSAWRSRDRQGRRDDNNGERQSSRDGREQKTERPRRNKDRDNDSNNSRRRGDAGSESSRQGGIRGNRDSGKNDQDRGSGSRQSRGQRGSRGRHSDGDKVGGGNRGAATSLSGSGRDNVSLRKMTLTKIPYPEFLNEKLDEVSSGESPFKRVKLVPKRSTRKQNVTAEEIREALRTGEDSKAILFFWDLENKSRLDELSNDDLYLLLGAIRRKPTMPRQALASCIFHELEVVRKTETMPFVAILNGLVIFIKSDRLDAVLGCVARLRKQGASFSAQLGGYVATAYLAQSPPDVVSASKMIVHVLKSLPKDESQTIAREPLLQLISLAPDLETGLFWHRTALHHYGFPADPISSKDKDGIHYTEPKAFNATWANFDLHLCILLGKLGKVDECAELVARYNKFAGSDNQEMDFFNHMKASLVVAHLNADEFEKALSLYNGYVGRTTAAETGPAEASTTTPTPTERASSRKSRGSIDGWATAEIMMALAVRDRHEEAMAILSHVVANVPRTAHDVKFLLTEPFATAIRITYPDVKGIVKLMGQMKEYGIKIQQENMALLGSSILTSNENLWYQISRIEMFPAYTLVYCIFQSLVMGDNIEKLPRVWKEILQPLTKDQPTPRILYHAYKACCIEGEYNYRILLTSDEFADKKFSDGKTGKEWAAEIGKTKTQIEKKLRSSGTDIELMEAEVAALENVSGLAH